MSNQPKWKCIANLGDVNPIDYGGYFIYIDETGHYEAEAEYLESPDSDEGEWRIYRFSLDRCFYNPDTDVLSDNPYHTEHPAWFAKPESERAERPQDITYLANVAYFVGVFDVAELRNKLISRDVIERAIAYREIAEYHGWENFDDYPLILTSRREVEKRYRKDLRQLKKLALS